jgi:hypothetical protein
MVIVVPHGGNNMTSEFLSFIDQITEFGKVFISSDRLFQLFVEKKHLSPNVAYGFKLRLQAKGIL